MKFKASTFNVENFRHSMSPSGQAVKTSQRGSFKFHD